MQINGDYRYQFQLNTYIKLWNGFTEYVKIIGAKAFWGS